MEFIEFLKSFFEVVVDLKKEDYDVKNYRFDKIIIDDSSKEIEIHLVLKEEK